MPDNIIQNVSIQGEGNIVVGKGDVIINPLPPAEARLRHDLGILMRNVETTWIKGVLEKSVHDAALLDLGMELREEAVDNPWRMVMEKPDQSREEIQRGRKIKDIFDEANRLLLILGEPGSGKTTTLLQLARDLMAEVDDTFTQPVPVILNLSAWTNKQQPLDEWLVLELGNKYRVPKRDGKKWLQNGRILPLLDGLDEVKVENRAACVESINNLVNEYGLQGLVICSRIKDYTELNVRLAFYRAIYLQPLTNEQVNEYLNKAGNKLVSLHTILQADNALIEMAQSPLILNVMCLAYQNASAEALRDPALASNKARRKKLFDAYIARMFNRKANANEYDMGQTKQHLAWLSRNMQRHNQEMFLIEGLQPDWLQSRYWEKIYTIASLIMGVLIVGLIPGLVFGLLDGRAFGLSIGLTGGLGFVLFFKLTGGRLDLELIGRQLGIGLSNGLILWWADKALGIVILYLGWLFFGPMGRKLNLENDIQTVESLHWSWHKARVGLIFGLVLGLMLNSQDLIYGQFGVLAVVLILGLFAAFFHGLNSEIIETKAFPNQGIWLSIRNAIVGGLIFGLLGLVFGLPGGLIGGLIGIIWYGGFNVIKHYTLRIILIIQGNTPRNYARFLDHAVDRIFLQKVGGGYRFIHRMLLDHFAEMYEPEKRA